MQEIERKKEAIRDNLRKMRENHDQMLATEHESRTIFNSIRKKKRLYQAMQQVQD